MQKESKSKGVRKANSSSPMAEAEAAQMAEEEREPECAHEHREIALQYAAQMPSAFPPSYLNSSRYNAHEELDSAHSLLMN